jgi:hypothetical protein
MSPEMPFRPLLLAALTLGLSAGCSKPPSSQSDATNEPGTTTAQAPSPEGARQPPSEPGSGGMAPPEGTKPREEGTAGATPTVYVVQLSGVRCMAAPCPTHLATPVNPPNAESLHIHEMDFSALNLPEERVHALNQRLEQGQVKLEASLSTRANAGPAGAATVLRVTKVLDGQ